MPQVTAVKEMIFQAMYEERSLDLIPKILERSQIKFETICSNPLKIKLPATTKALTVMIVLLEELKPKGSIIIDENMIYDVDENGLEKLRQIALRTLENARPRNALRNSLMVKRDRAGSVESVFSGDQLILFTACLFVIIGVSIGVATMLSLADRIGELLISIILGGTVVGTISVMFRYASGLKKVEFPTGGDYEPSS